MKKILVASAISIVLVTSPASAHAFSLKKFLANPFKVSISSVLNPFHIVYKLNKITGQNPTAGIPQYAFTPQNAKFFKENGEWRWSWEEETPPILYPVNPPDIIPIEPTPRPVPPPVVVTPPCNRGGPGITPC